jgi:hypothetical protein
MVLWLVSLFLPKAKPVIETPIPQTTTTQESIQTPLVNEQLKEEQEERVQTSSMTTTAKLFVERYGSYSNEANFQNIRDVIPLMSVAFADATTADLATKTPPTGFYGVTTRVISVKVVSQNETEGTAELLLSTQRTEEKGSAQNTTTKYQDVQLMIVTETGVWKVDSVTWL